MCGFNPAGDGDPATRQARGGGHKITPFTFPRVGPERVAMPKPNFAHCNMNTYSNNHYNYWA